MNTVEKNLLTTAAVGIGGIIIGFQGLKKVVGCGHNVANGLRWTADKVDAGTDWGVKKCDDGIEFCEAVQATYEAEAAALENQTVEEVLEAKEEQQVPHNRFMDNMNCAGDAAIA